MNPNKSKLIIRGEQMLLLRQKSAIGIATCYDISWTLKLINNLIHS